MPDLIAPHGGLTAPLNCTVEPDREEEFRRELVDETPGPEERLDMKEQQRRLTELLSALPPRYRAVVVLRHQDDLSYEEIADILGLPLGGEAIGECGRTKILNDNTLLKIMGEGLQVTGPAV